MPYVNKPRPYKKEYQQQKSRGESDDRLERQRARAAFDKKHGKSARSGLDISHRKALKDGGENADGYRLESPSTNRARGGASSKPPKKKK
tara:strand:+ start:4065 stop:4334 length:270 start_codon:yes stop_codon:yes gene_type:complete